MSKMSNLKKGVVGVCAATMLTGMCAVPAFAEVGVTNPESATSIESGTTSDTDVSIEAAATQISATVPTSVMASVDSTGEMTFPDSTEFQIKATNSSWPVKVSKLEVKAGTGYSLKAENSLAASKDIYLAIGGTSLDSSANIDTAIGSLAQTSANGDPISIAMTGKMYKPAISDINSAVPAAKLTWTLSVF